jgi:hypothetical protein
MRMSDHAPVTATWMACFMLLSGGCTVGLGSLVLPTRVVPREIVEGHQTARIDSEPRGAEVVEDEAVLGKTPARIDLSYQEEPHRREVGACWAFVPLAVVDLAIAAAGVWASYACLYNSDAGKSVCAFGEEHKSCMPAVAVAGMIASGVYAWSAVKAARKELSSGCYVGGAPSRIIPRRHALRLKKDGWEEKLDLEAPRPPHSSDSPPSRPVRQIELAPAFSRSHRTGKSLGARTPGQRYDGFQSMSPCSQHGPSPTKPDKRRWAI